MIEPFSYEGSSQWIKIPGTLMASCMPQFGDLFTGMLRKAVTIVFAGTYPRPARASKGQVSSCRTSTLGDNTQVENRPTSQANEGVARNVTERVRMSPEVGAVGEEFVSDEIPRGGCRAFAAVYKDLVWSAGPRPRPG